MKKIHIGAPTGILLFVLFGAVGYWFANSQFNNSRFNGFGMMGSRGWMMGGRGYSYDGGLLDDKMTAAMAEKLNMSANDLESRLNKGESMYQIAVSKGITAENFTTMMNDVRTQVIDQAVKDGTITQDQADWMKQRGFGMGGRSFQGNRYDCPCLDQADTD